jgi:hypothetical protein
MKHIRKRDSVTNKIINEIYTVVITKEWTLPLEQHPSVIENPEVFEVIDCELPDYYQQMFYVSNAGIVYE